MLTHHSPLSPHSPHPEVCSLGGFQAPVPPAGRFSDQMAHIRSQLATYCPLWAHVLDLSQPEQLIPLDALGRAPCSIPPSAHELGSCRQSLGFRGGPVASKRRHGSGGPGAWSQMAGWGPPEPCVRWAGLAPPLEEGVAQSPLEDGVFEGLRQSRGRSSCPGKA